MIDSNYKKEIRNLLSSKNNGAFYSLIISYVIIFFSFFLLYFQNSISIKILFFISIGIMQYRIVIACHEAVHFGLFKSKFMNEFMGVFNCSLIGLNLKKYRKQHIAHHRAKTIREDSDSYIYLPILNAKPGLSRILILFFGTFQEIFQKFKMKSVYNDKSQNTSGVDKNSIFLVFTQFLILFLISLFFHWKFYFYFWVLPLLTVAVFINRVRVFIEHCYVFLVKENKIEDLLDSPLETIDVESNFLEKFIIAPFSFNFHRSHHMIPGLPYYNHKKLQKILYDFKKNKLMIHNSYTSILFKLMYS
jgi:fatty acid desaturase